jgi:hypothetical protein
MTHPVCEKMPAMNQYAGVEMARQSSSPMLAEMKEFAAFGSAEHRYIRRSLNVAENGLDAITRWSRSAAEEASIRAQARLYKMLLAPIRSTIPDDLAIDAVAEIVGPLTTLSVFDLGEGKLRSFASYRFLYERLLGGTVRPWLVSAFLAAGALPTIHPSLRRLLLSSITENDVTAAGWSIREPAFMPEWVEKVPVAVS